MIRALPPAKTGRGKILSILFHYNSRINPEQGGVQTGQTITRTMYPASAVRLLHEAR
jgi:hypothetical protein